MNSSLAQSAAELWMANVCPEMANFTICEIFIFVKNSFWAIILAPDMLPSQSKALKTQITA